MEAMIPSQVEMSLWTLQKIKEASEAQKNKRGQRSPPKKRRTNERNREGTMLLSFSTLVLQSSTMFFIESLLFCHFHITSVISSFAQPLSFLFELSYTYSSSSFVAWQSLITHIDIY